MTEVMATALLTMASPNAQATKNFFMMYSLIEPAICGAQNCPSLGV
jgi:hypothetical protein